VPAPSVEQVTEYLTSGNGPSASFTVQEVTDALAAETAAQAKACTIPDPFPADLAEALKRRVAHNLALRGLPLGIQASISEVAVTTTRVGGLDAEVARFERPYRKLVVG
jgi:hypothetical protein